MSEDDWVLVPREPTEAMWRAAETAIDDFSSESPAGQYYRAMIAAAPQADVADVERVALEGALRSLASYVGAGGYNAETVDPAVFEGKIRWGIDHLIGATIQRCADVVEQQSKNPARATWGAVRSAILDLKDTFTMTTRPAGVEETNMPSFVHASQVGGYVELTEDVRRSDGALFPKGMKLQLVRLEKAGYPYWWIARDPKTGEECMLFDAHELTFSNARKAPGDRETPKYVPCDGPAGEEEVAQVVAWLRSGDENDLIARRIADAIERGEHRGASG